MQQVLTHFARNFTLEFLAIPPRFLFFGNECNTFLNESIQPFSGRGCAFFSRFASHEAAKRVAINLSLVTLVTY